MLTSEVPSPRDPELVERLILDLLDPELKGHALSELRKVIYIFSGNCLLHHSFYLKKWYGLQVA